jgi:ABC-type multidrug transport system permease subunit
MKLQRITALVGKDMKKLLREPALLFLLILFPIMLTLVFGFSFGAIGGAQQTTFQIGLVNMNAESLYPQYAQNFIANLTSVQMLKIQVYSDNETAQLDLVQGKIQAVLIIPENFGESCHAFQAAPNDPAKWINITIPLYLDSGSMLATQAIPPVIQQILATTIYGNKQAVFPQPIHLGIPSLVGVSKRTVFDYMAPGLFAYASIFLTITVAQSFTSDRENGMLRRINTTPTTATEFMISQAFSNMIIGVIQAILIFVTAYAVGFRPEVEASSMMLAFVTMLIFSLCNVGFGLITATLAKSSSAATGIAFIFILPQMFLGTFVGAALSSIAQVAGHFVPSYYVTDAFTSLLLRKASITSPTVLLDLATTSFLSLTVLAFGVLLFRKYGKA